MPKNIKPYIGKISAANHSEPIGTGFIVQHKGEQLLIITCRHVIEQAAGNSLTFTLFASGKVLVAEVARSLPDKDVALLTARVAENEKFATAKISKSADFEGLAFSMSGYLGRENNFGEFTEYITATGNIAGPRDRNGSEYFTIITKDALTGMSGSPVEVKGKGVVGIFTDKYGVPGQPSVQGYGIYMADLVAVLPEVFDQEKGYDALLRTYLREVIVSNNEIGLPSIKEKESLPKIPLDKVYVALKVQKKANRHERARAVKLFYKKVEKRISEKQASLRRNLSLKEQEQAQDEVLKENPVMQSMLEDERNVLSIDRSGQDRSSLEPKIINLAEAFKKERHIVILGDPGSGKSTLSKWLVLRLAQAMLREIETGKPQFVQVPADQVEVIENKNNNLENLGPARLPVLVRISEFAKSVDQHNIELIDYLQRTFDELGRHLGQKNLLVSSYLKKGRAVIILDGMDEVLSTSRKSVIGKIEAFIGKWIDNNGDAPDSADVVMGEPAVHGGNQVIVTSRIVGYQSQPLGGDLTHLTIEKMEEPAVRYFCKVWTEQVHLQENKGKLNEREILELAADESNALQEAIYDMRKPRIKELATNPLLVTILALVFRHGDGVEKQLPGQRAELYQRALDILIEKWRENVKMTSNEIQYVMPAVAYSIHCAPTDEITESELRTIVIRELKRYRKNLSGVIDKKARLDVDDFIEKIKEEVGLLAERGLKIYHFLHRTFQEYLAGIFLVREASNIAGNIISRIEDPVWREPILLSIGYLDIKEKASGKNGQIDALVKAMLHADDPLKDLLPRGALFVAMALPEMDHLDDQMVHEIILRLLDTYHSNYHQESFRSLNNQIEQAIVKLFTGHKGKVIETQLIDLLVTSEQPSLISAIIHLFGKYNWFKPEYQGIFSQLIHKRTLAGTWTADAILRRFRSINPDEDGFAKHNLRLRRRLLEKPQLVTVIQGDLRWIRLIAAIYGGFSDDGLGALMREFEGLKLKIFLKEGSDDERYNHAVRLDTEQGKVKLLKKNCPVFDPKYIYRDSFLTPAILRVLQNDGNAPESLISDIEDMLLNSGDAELQGEGLVALKMLGHDVQLTIDKLNRHSQYQEIISYYQQFLGQVKRSVTDPLMKFHSFFAKNLQEFGLLVADQPEALRQYAMALTLGFFSEYGLPPLGIAYAIREKQPFETDDAESQAWLEAEGWAARFSMVSDDPVYNMAVVLDTIPLLLTRENLLSGAFSLLDRTINLRGKFFLGAVSDHSFMKPFDAETRHLTALDNLRLVPERMEFVRDWALKFILSEKSIKPELILYGILANLDLKKPDIAKKFHPELWESDKPLQAIAEKAVKIRNRYIKCLTFIKLHDLTHDPMIYLTAVDHYFKLEDPRQVVTAAKKLLAFIPDVKDFNFVYILPDQKSAISLFSFYLGIYEHAQKIVNNITEPETFVRLALDLAVLNPVSFDEALFLNALEQIAAMTGDVRQRGLIQELQAFSPDDKRLKAALQDLIARVEQQWRLERDLLSRIAADSTRDLKAGYFFPLLSIYQDCPVGAASTDRVMPAVAETGSRSQEEEWKLLTAVLENGRSAFRLSKMTADLIESNKHKKIFKFLAYLEKPEANAQSVVSAWRDSDTPVLAHFYYLLEAEQGRLTSKGFDALIQLMKHEDDRLRERAAIAVHGALPSGNTIYRVYQASTIGLDNLVDIYRMTDAVGDVRLKSKLKWFSHNLYFNDPEMLQQIVAIAERGEASRHHYKIISEIEFSNSGVVDALLAASKSKNRELRKAVIKSLFRLANFRRHNFLAKFEHWFTSVDEEIIKIAQSFITDGNTFQLIYDSLVIASQTDDGREKHIIAEAHYWAVSKIDFHHSWKAGPDQLLVDFAKAGSSFYYQPSNIISASAEFSNQILEKSELLDILAQWAFYAMEELVSGEEAYYNMSADLAILLSVCVQANPDFLGELDHLSDVEHLLISIVNHCNSWVCRRGAIVLLSYMPEISVNALQLIVKSLKDIPFVREGIVQCWKYFKVGLDDQTIKKLIENISSDSGIVAATSIRLLSETCKGIQGNERLRKEIIIALANELRMHKKDLTRITNIYISENDGSIGGLVYEGNVEEVLYSELIKVSGLS